jgi:hypothetical protein
MTENVILPQSPKSLGLLTPANESFSESIRSGETPVEQESIKRIGNRVRINAFLMPPLMRSILPSFLER